MPRSNKARVPQLLRLCSRARELQLLSLRCYNYRSPRALEPVLCNEDLAINK